MKIDWSNSSILVTGGTGSFGRKFVEIALKRLHPRRLVVFSRDELKQHEMRQIFPDNGNSPMRYFIGDIRDAERLKRAFEDVDIVIHAAALKQVPTCEYNPIEAVATNVNGAKNVIEAALDNAVKNVMFLSTDKAVNPINLYGGTKLVAEKLIIQANAYSGNRPTRFSCVRYGNVMGSRGSVIPILFEQKKSGTVTVTDRQMTRFWITLQQGVEFVIKCLDLMRGGEVFIPKIPSAKISDLVKVIAPGCKVQYIGIRPGEKLHEVLISQDEARKTLEFDDMFLIQPNHSWWKPKYWTSGKRLSADFKFTSDTNSHQLSVKDLQKLISSLT